MAGSSSFASLTTTLSFPAAADTSKPMRLVGEQFLLSPYSEYMPSPKLEPEDSLLLLLLEDQDQDPPLSPLNLFTPEQEQEADLAALDQQHQSRLPQEAMDQETFYLLDQTFPASQGPKLLCSAVASKQSPRAVSAPFGHGAAPPAANISLSSAQTQTQPAAAPRPFTTRVTCSSIYTLQHILSSSWVADAPKARISQLLLDLPSSASLTSSDLVVRRYTLDNPQQCFQRLLSDPSTAKDVRALVSQCLPRYAYFVTGFLSVAESSSSDYLPAVDSLSFITPFLQRGGSQDTLLPDHSADEHIFAASYAVIKLAPATPSPPMATPARDGSPSGSGSNQPQSHRHHHHQGSMPPEYGRPPRANATHLASSGRTLDHWTTEPTTQVALSVPSTPLAAAAASLLQAQAQARSAKSASPAAAPVLVIDQNSPHVKEPANPDALVVKLPKTS